MKVFIIILAFFLNGCASVSSNSNNYNSLDNYEIVFVDDKITKTSELALKQINNNNSIYKINIEIFRTNDNDLKSIMSANNNKKIIDTLLTKKDIKFKYTPKIKNKNIILKVEK